VKYARPLAFLAPLLLIAASGCGDAGQQASTQEKESPWKKGSKAAAEATAPGKAAVAKSGKRKRPTAVPLDGATIRTSSWDNGGRSSGSGSSSYSENGAVEQIGKAVRQSLDLGPTLVVWMFDRSDSASRLTTSSLNAAKSLYAAQDISAAAKENKLVTAVVGFGEKSDFLLDPPTGDPTQVTAALDTIKTEPGNKEATFAALKLVLEKYLPVRTKERREVVIAIITDEPGDDMAVLDDAVAIAQKNAIPIYVVGPSAPLGKALPMQGMAGKAEGKDTRTYAADTYFHDWVSFPGSGYGTGDSYDSALGPWSLERLCRESSGLYLSVGTLGTTFSNRAGRDGMAKYAPDYLPVAAMQKSLDENRCRKALVEAAKLPPSKSLLNPQTIFPKRGEAETKRMLDKAQLDAAKLEPEVNRIYDTLAGDSNSVEADRAKLTGTRWQVAYDTAFGRAAAMKVRVDGYNSMLAALKRGKSFENPNSTTWVLEPSDTIETGSAMQKLADKAKTYLERVKKEHPDTPWAQAAEQELRMPLGWKWQEQ
jgi:hypothetical protein